MKIGEQQVYGAETGTRRDENIGLAREGMDLALMVGGSLKQPQRGGAHRHHAPARLPRSVDGPRRSFTDLAGFGMHRVVVHVLGLHRQESARPHMQGEGGMAYVAHG